jgi:C1A family cysteine protease
MADLNPPTPPPLENQIIEHHFQLNYVPRVPDPRDYTYHYNENEKKSIVTKKGKTIKTLFKATLPASFSLQSSMAPILNQGNLGSCVCNAFALTISTQTKKNVNQSRLFHYANCRILQGDPINVDNGTGLGTACSAILNYGACQETVWPYTSSNYGIYPPLSAFQGSKKFKTFTYTFINQTLLSLQTVLYTNNVPIIFGFLVYSSFMSVSKNGIVPVPNTKTESLQGGHCMVLLGYDNSKQWFICANSWGTGWGDKGYCYIPYSYLLNSNLAFDFCQTTFVY